MPQFLALARVAEIEPGASDGAAAAGSPGSAGPGAAADAPGTLADA